MKNQEIEVYVLYHLNYIKKLYLYKLKRKFAKPLLWILRFKGDFPFYFFTLNSSLFNKNCLYNEDKRKLFQSVFPFF